MGIWFQDTGHGTLSANSVVGCSLTDDYWKMHIHDVHNASTQDYLAVLIDLISALFFFTQLPEFCPIVSCCIDRRERAEKEARFAAPWNDSRWHRWLCWVYTVSAVLADWSYHTLPFFPGLTYSKRSMLYLHLYHKFRGRFSQRVSHYHNLCS